ncbi:hypothetical protein F0562_022457 [Nyssa sinensis]|uniref:Uncharacterized protein n=1 Tax=Nyssa sinensis TaxID=561372 RepID=A0A5J5BMZ1_9ASTE|nr:hypothetical protein F0562_022457 [Nyssa sinensis]
MSSTKAANKVEEFQKRLEEAKMELGTSQSLTDELKEQLAESSNTISARDSEIHSLGNKVANLKQQISDLRSEMSVVETTAFEAKARHHSEIEVAEKMAKAFLEIDTEVPDHIKVSDVESKDFENNEVSKGLVALTDL